MNKYKKLIMPFLAAFVSMVILLFFLRNHQLHCSTCSDLNVFTPSVIKHYILGFGPWSFLVYVIFYAVNTVSILPPIGIMSLAAGFIFGPFVGTVALTLGAFLGTSATFFISRLFGSKFVQQFIEGRAQDFQEKLDKNGFKVILFIRLIPILPWEVVNYVSGLSNIRYRDYITATILGVFPAIVIQTFFSDKLANFSFKDPTIIIAIGAFILLCAIPAIYLKYKNNRQVLKDE